MSVELDMLHISVNDLVDIALELRVTIRVACCGKDDDNYKIFLTWLEQTKKTVII